MLASEKRARRELRTVRAMIAIYCRATHGSRRDLCPECSDLYAYAHERVERCPLIDDKPTCVNCPVHCYKPAMCDQIKVVMRYSGPRILWHHPILAILHLFDGRRDDGRSPSRLPSMRKGARTIAEAAAQHKTRSGSR